MAQYLATTEQAGTGAIMTVNIDFKGNDPEVGSGSTPYINRADVKAAVVTKATESAPESSVAIGITYVGPTTFRTNSAVPVGKVLRVYRDTQDEYGLVQFQALQTVTELDLDLNARQMLYVAMETRDAATRAAEISAFSDSLSRIAIEVANAAGLTAANAVVTAGEARSLAASAVNAANAATQTAYQAEQKSQAALDGVEDAVQAAADATAAAARATAASEEAQANAQTYVDAKTARFLGPHTTDPATRDDGTPLQSGDRYFNPLAGVEYIYSNGNWVATNVDGAALAGPGGGSLIGVMVEPTGVTQKLVEIFQHRDTYVTSFGAGAGGDDTAKFEAAALVAIAKNNITGARGDGGIPRAGMAVVIVPPGEYDLRRMLNVQNKVITWDISQGAKIKGYNFLNGNTHRPGQRMTKQSVGSVDYACGFSIRMNNEELDAIAEVTGVPTPAGYGRYGDRDSVGLYADNTSRPALVETSSGTYTATTVTIPAMTAEQMLQLRVGMYVETKDATPYVGLLTAWNTAGTELTVEGWYLVNGTVGPKVTPTTTAGLYVNRFTKVWALNGNIYLPANGAALGGTGYEQGVFNFKGDSSLSIANKNNRTWGFDAVSLGTGSYRNQVGHITRGKWVYGCASYGDVLYPIAHFDENNVLGFRIDGLGNMEMGKNNVSGVMYADWHTSGKDTDYDVRFLFSGGNSSNGAGTLQIAAAKVLTTAIEVDYLSPGSIELGGNHVTTAGVRFIDAHTSGNNIDYDARIEFSGGSATPGAGAVTIRSASLDVTGTLRPETDAALPLGQSTRRFSNIFAQNIRPGAGGVVWTSGVGSPEGAVSAPVGSMFTRTDGGANTTLYVKESGTGTTGWKAK